MARGSRGKEILAQIRCIEERRAEDVDWQEEMEGVQGDGVADLSISTAWVKHSGWTKSSPAYLPTTFAIPLFLSPSLCFFFSLSLSFTFSQQHPWITE